MDLPEELKDTPIVILTGAGASIPLGLPATKEFLETFRSKVTNTWHVDEPPGYLRFVQDRLSTDESDIEAVLGRLENESNWCGALETDPLFTSEVLGGNTTRLLAFQTKADQLREDIYDEVITTYGNVDPERAADLYRGLLGHYMLYFRELCGGRPTLPFFTLNYDTAIEEAAARLSIPCVDGIQAVPGSSYRQWTPTAYTQYKPAEGAEVCVVLVKLHGSVRLLHRVTHDQEMFIEVPPGLARDPAPNTHVVLYPSLLPKPITTEPFRTGYRMLQTCLNSSGTYCLVVIGCSFRDTELNTVLRDALEDNPQLRLVVVDPKLDHETVALNITCSPEKVRVIQIPFGPESAGDLKSGHGRVVTQLRLWIGLGMGAMNFGNQTFGGTSA
jgi:hypothetical protein